MANDTESQGRRVPTPQPPAPTPKLSRQAKQLIERIRHDNRDEDAVRELKAYYESVADQPSIANLLEGWGAVLDDPARAAGAFMEASEAVLAGTGDLARARYLCERALACQPSHAAALNRLCALLEADRDYVHLEQRLRFLVNALRATEHDPQYLALVLHRLGQVHHRWLGQPAAARRAYREALEINPRLVPAIVALRQLYLESETFGAAAILYEMQIASTDAADDRATLWAELARLRAGPLDEPDAAILAYRRSLRERPHSLGTLDELAATLVRRAAGASADQGLLDRARAAHVLFQSALVVPRAEAAARLQRCIDLEPTHARALGMLRELASYGAHTQEVEAAQRPQAVLDASTTARVEPELVERAAREAGVSPHHSTSASPHHSTSASPLDATSAAEEWLTTGELEPVPPTDTGRLGPITDRPPPPPATAPEARSSAAELAARLKRAREQAAARRSTPPPPLTSAGVPSHRGPDFAPEAHEQPAAAAFEGGALLLSELDEDLERMPIEVNLGATTEANLFVGFDGRVQAGGVFVPTYAPLSENTPVLLQLTLPGGFDAQAHGRVRFVRDAFDFTAEQIPGMGVQFESLTPEALALCERFAQKRSPMFFDA